MLAQEAFRGERTFENKEFAERDVFLHAYSGFVGVLVDSENFIGGFDLGGKKVFVRACGSRIEAMRETLSTEEINLVEQTFDLYRIKNSLPPFDRIPEISELALDRGRQELTVEMAGPIASGKTTVGDFLAEELGAKKVSEGFVPEENPFLAPSYEDPSLMFRTQLKFLLDNIAGGTRGKYQDGRWVRDTSVWSDIYIFMEWRKRMGKVTPEEHGAYMNTVELLEPLIHKPDLLVMLIPDSLDNLKQGLDSRIDANPQDREMERSITNGDLDCVIESARSAVEVMRQKGIRVMVEDRLDPVELYERPELKYSTVYAIRGELGILSEYLTKDPAEAAKEIAAIFAPSRPPQVVVVHSESMFTGKTSTLNKFVEIVGEENVVAFQPQAALRYGDEHEENMMDRDRHKTPAKTIESNRLEDILAILDRKGKRITADKKPFILIDEVMLFIENDKDEAIAVIEELGRRGFQVIVNGIDWTFQKKPFTFMQDLLERAVDDENWHEIKMGTRCRYCDSPAHGSRRYTRSGEIADYKDTVFQAGENYEPVCCNDGHVSCRNQPEDFARRPLPTERKISNAKDS
ncbi:deoxynucleoside kinase [Patescibacteria group bacterium]